MKLIGEILQQSTLYLRKLGVLQPRISSELLLAHLLQLKRLDLYLQFDRPLEEKELSTYREFLKRRAKGEPIEQIIGEMVFYQCKIQITQDVLIPRPETEILLDLACKQITPQANQIALDLCTGSGCLAIGLKKRFPSLTVIATDLSNSALKIARANATANQVDIDFIQSDLLQKVPKRLFHFVFSNPPYLSLQEYATLHREVRDFEPSTALIAGKTGCEFFERISRELPPYLEENAQLFLEIGASQEKPLLKIFQSPLWKNVRIERDFANHPRFLFSTYAKMGRDKKGMLC